MTAAANSCLPLPEAPYRGLAPYRFCDQAIFFEREVEAERLIRLAMRYRASLLYGESGVGKSSLINAGLIPKALEEGMVVERLRVQPRAGLEFVVERISRSANDDEFLPSVLIRTGEPQRMALSAEEFAKRLGESAGTMLLVIFDQFEEFLTLAADAAAADTLDSQNRILNSLVALIQGRKNTNLRLLFVFREDYLAKFERFFYFCPELPDRFLRLTSPPASSLHRVLRGPFQSERIPPGYWQREVPEPVLAALEQQLRPAEEGAGISLSKVQIAALQVWRSADPVKYFTGRKVDDLVNDYLQSQLKRFGEQRRVAESLLSLMITRQGTRRVITDGEVIEEAGRQDGLPPDRVSGALERLVSETRLVRRDHHRGATTYEIVSEFLVPWILPLKLQRQARRARNLWLKRAAALVVVLGAVLGGVFYWKYRATTLEALQTSLVQKFKTAATQADAEAAAARDEAVRAKLETAQLNQKLLELQKLLNNQTSEKQLQDDLNGKNQELARQQAQNRELTQQIEKLRHESTDALEAEKKGRAAEVANLQKQLKEPRAETKQNPGPKPPEPGTPAAVKENEITKKPAGSSAPRAAILDLPHDKNVRSAAFSPKGERIVSIASNAAYIWDAKTGEKVGKPLAHLRDIAFAEFSLDSSRIVTVSSREARVWDAKTGESLTPLLVHSRNVISAALRDDGRLVTATSHGIYVWDPAAPGVAKELKVTGIPLESGGRTLLSPNGRRILILSEDSAQVREVDSDKLVGTDHPHKHIVGAGGAAFSPGGLHVIVHVSNKSFQVYEVETGKEEGQFTVNNEFSPVALDDSGRLAVTVSNGSAQMWDVAKGQPLGGSIPGIIETVSLSPDGHSLVTSAYRNKIVRLFQIAAN